MILQQRCPQRENPDPSGRKMSTGHVANAPQWSVVADSGQSNFGQSIFAGPPGPTLRGRCSTEAGVGVLVLVVVCCRHPKRQKERTWGRERVKSAKILGSPTLWEAHPSEPHFFRVGQNGIGRQFFFSQAPQPNEKATVAQEPVSNWRRHSELWGRRLPTSERR